MEVPPERALRMFRAIGEGNVREELERIEDEEDEVKRMIYYLAYAKFISILRGDLKDVEGYELRRDVALEALSRANEIASKLDNHRRLWNILHQADIRIDLNAGAEEYVDKFLSQADDLDDDQLLKASVVLARLYRFKESKEMAEKIKHEGKRKAALDHLKLRMLFG